MVADAARAPKNASRSVVRSVPSWRRACWPLGGVRAGSVVRGGAAVVDVVARLVSTVVIAQTSLTAPERERATIEAATKFTPNVNANNTSPAAIRALIPNGLASP